MKIVLNAFLALLITLLLAGAGAGYWYVSSKLPKRHGVVTLDRLSSFVTVRYDERGVPHIQASNELDLYRALGYVHAQDRLFQMEMLRRVARGEMAEVLGVKMVNIDRLFRTLGLRDNAEKVVAQLDMQSPAVMSQLAYLDGINQFQSTHPVPMEFDILGITRRDFTLQDTLAISGYLAYSFAAAFKTEPLLSFIRDELGTQYMTIFDQEWNPLGVIDKANNAHKKPDWQALAQLAQISNSISDLTGLPLFEGSNAWVVSGQRSSSGKPILAGDPHMSFALPSAWYEAHLSMPDFDLYGHFQALNSAAMLGHNMQFGWSLTLLQNDDMDMVTETINPNNPDQVWFQGHWVDMPVREEIIKVKAANSVTLRVQTTPDGPIITDAFSDQLNNKTPVALWWTFLQTDNKLLQAFYDLNRADTLVKARHAASQIHAPGMNILWASETGDIAWWAAAKLPIRRLNVNPAFILDGSKPEADKLGYYRFEDNPQEENPARGYIMSANQQPDSISGLPIPGYYNLYDRAQALNNQLGNDATQWNLLNTQSLQLSTQTLYPRRILKPLLPALTNVVRDPMERSIFDSLVQWDGQYTQMNIPPTVFTQFLYELTRAAMYDELGPAQFKNLLGTRALDLALPLLAEDTESPWWDNVKTPETEECEDIVEIAWNNTMKHLKETFGNSPNGWGWGKAHTLTHVHPLASQSHWDWIFNVGPFEMPGGREVPNNMSTAIGPAPWAVNYGPSTRRVIDFNDASTATGINPVGQSGVWFDSHYKDQAATFVAGGYMPQHLSEKDIATNTQSTLTFKPATPVAGSGK
jgi:penicillin amidase